MTAPEMTSRDRDHLAKIVKARARVAKSSVAQRRAQLLADFEEQISAVYDSRDQAWADVVAEAMAKVAEVDAFIAQRCRERGIAEELRPRMASGFIPRGQNGNASRRVELRKLAERRIDSASQAAKLEIDRADCEVQVELLTGALSTESARRFLERIPTAERLMPALQLGELEQQVKRTPALRELL